MKQFLNVSKWGMMFLAALCVGLTSCSEDEETVGVEESVVEGDDTTDGGEDDTTGGEDDTTGGDEGDVPGGDEGGTPGDDDSKPGSMTYGMGNTQFGTISATYDAQGRPTGMAQYLFGTLVLSETVTYGDGVITVVEKEIDEDATYTSTTNYFLGVGGRIVSADEVEVDTYTDEDGSRTNTYKFKYTYAYDETGKLISCAEGHYIDYLDEYNYYTYNYVWENGNIVREETEYGGGMTFTYMGNSDVLGLNGRTSYDFGDNNGLLYMQGYFGVKSKNLVKSYQDISSGYSTTFDYEMNGDKVKKLTISDSEEGSTWVKFN